MHEGERERVCERENEGERERGTVRQRGRGREGERERGREGERERGRERERKQTFDPLGEGHAFLEGLDKHPVRHLRFQGIAFQARGLWCINFWV